MRSSKSCTALCIAWSSVHLCLMELVSLSCTFLCCAQCQMFTICLQRQQRCDQTYISYTHTVFSTTTEQHRLQGAFLVLSGTLDNCWLLLYRLHLLVLCCLTECGAESLGSDAQPTCLLNDRLVYWQCWVVNLNDILQTGLLKSERIDGWSTIPF